MADNPLVEALVGAFQNLRLQALPTLRLSKFSGRPKKAGELSLKEWVQDVESYCRQLQLEGEQKANTAFDYLTGEAREEILCATPETRKDFEKIKDVLHRRFGPYETVSSLHTEFHNRVQGVRESFCDFSRDLIRIYNKMIQAAETEEKKKALETIKEKSLQQRVKEGCHEKEVTREMYHLLKVTPKMKFTELREELLSIFPDEPKTKASMQQVLVNNSSDNAAQSERGPQSSSRLATIEKRQDRLERKIDELLTHVKSDSKPNNNSQPQGGRRYKSRNQRYQYTPHGMGQPNGYISQGSKQQSSFLQQGPLQEDRGMQSGIWQQNRNWPQEFQGNPPMTHSRQYQGHGPYFRDAARHDDQLSPHAPTFREVPQQNYGISPYALPYAPPPQLSEPTLMAGNSVRAADISAIGQNQTTAHTQPARVSQHDNRSKETMTAHQEPQSASLQQAESVSGDFLHHTVKMGHVQVDANCCDDDRDMITELIGNSPTVVIDIDGVPTKCIADTGAETSLVSFDYYRQHLAKEHSELAPLHEFVKLVGANDLEIPVIGVFTPEITVFGHSFTGCFLVKEASHETHRRRQYPVLLGCNILRKLLKIQGLAESSDDWKIVGRSFDLQANSVFVDSEGKSTNPALPIPLYSGSGFTVVQPQSVRTVKCYPRPRSGINQKELYIQEVHLGIRTLGASTFVNDAEGTCDRRLVQVVPAFVQAITPHVTLKLVNRSRGSVVIPPATKLCMALEAHAVDQIQLDTTPEGLRVHAREIIVEDGLDDSSSPNVSEQDSSLHSSECETFCYPDGSRYQLPPGISLMEFERPQAAKVAKMIERHDEAFSKGPLDLGSCDLIPHRIVLKDPHPVNLPYRRIAPHLIQEVKDQLQEMYRKGIIKKSCSPYASAVVPIRKKDGSVRICIDYRQLNSKTERDAFPLPRIEETLDVLAGSTIFSSLDLAHGYFQVMMHPDSVPLTAFRVPWGLFEFQRMPQGLVNSPATFERVMEHVFGDINLTEVAIYLDDILVYAPTFDQHLERLERVLDRLTSVGLKLNGKKCKLFQDKVVYLGHVVSGAGIAVDPSKVACVTAWPRPVSSAQVSSFLGLASYFRKFIPDFASIARPLYEISKPGKKAGKPSKEFTWTEETETAFTNLKTVLSNAPVLAFPQFNKEFVLEIDASLRGLGACLSQTDEENKLHPIAYASRSLRGAEKVYPEYSSFKLELLALKWAVTDKFREYLIGAHCIVYTDNNPLVHLFTAKLGATEMRWAAQLAMFDLELRYRTGKSNRCADALSRYPTNVQSKLSDVLHSTAIPVEVQEIVSDKNVTAQENEPDIPAVGPGVLPAYTHAQLAEMQKSDDALKHVWALWDVKWQLGEDRPDHNTGELHTWIKIWPSICEKHGVLYRKFEDPALGEVLQILVPFTLRNVLITAAHDHWGHQGVDRTYKLLRTRAFWPGMRSHIKNHVKQCYKCVKSKVPTIKVRPPMRHLVAFRPMELVAIDFVKLDRGKGGFEDVLTITDAFSKWAQAVPCKDQSAKTTAKALMQNWFSSYSIPLRLHSDQGRNFEGELIRELCHLYGITRSRTTPWHPAGNAITERFNKTLCSLIKSVEKCHRHEWPDQIRHLVFVYNTTPHSVTGVAPYVLLFGREPTLPVDHLIGRADSDWGQDFVKEQAVMLKKAWEIANRRMEASQQADKARFDRKANASPIPVGSRVLLKQTGFTDRHKLEDYFSDVTYVVVDRNKDQDVYTIRPATGGKERRVNRRMLALDPRKEYETEIDLSDVLPQLEPADLNDDSDSDDSGGGNECQYMLVGDPTCQQGEGDHVGQGEWTQAEQYEHAPNRQDEHEDVPSGASARTMDRMNRGQHSNPHKLPRSVLQ